MPSSLAHRMQLDARGDRKSELGKAGVQLVGLARDRNSKPDFDSTL